MVNQNGGFRFRFTPWDLFIPVGIATDSQGRILISGRDRDMIHILDHDGYFFRYISNCYLQCPWGLSINSFNQLFVAEKATGIVKRIQYSM